MGYIGNNKTTKLYKGSNQINKMYIGETVYHGNNGTPPIPPTEANYTLLYYLGDECTDITGGWSISLTHSSGYTFTKNTDNLYLGIDSGSSVRKLVVSTNNSIDISNYSVFAVIWEAKSVNWTILRNLLANSRNTDNEGYYQDYQIYFGTSNLTLPKKLQFKDISLTGQHYSQAYAQMNSSRGAWLKLYVNLVAKNDNLTNLISVCGLSQTTTDTILASTTEINKLFASETTIREMLKLTGDFMIKAMANTQFMNTYKNSQYKSLIDSNEHWGKFITLV